MLDLVIPARDGVQLAATLFEPPAPGGAALLLNGGTGIPRQFYAAFAAHLAQRGFAVLTYDYRGMGGSQAPSSAAMEQWGCIDQASMIDHLARLRPGATLGLVGHSLDGQVLGLADNIGDIRAALLVCSQSGHWLHWPRGRGRLRMLALWWLLIPGSWVGTAGLPVGIARMLGALGALAPLCLRRARTGAEATQRRCRLSHPLDELRGRSHRAVRRGRSLALLLSRAAVDRLHLGPCDLGVDSIGHFGFFRKSMRRAAWDAVAAWFEERLLASMGARGQIGRRSETRETPACPHRTSSP